MKIKIDTIEFNVESSLNSSFWGSVKNGGWEPETFEIMKKYLDKDHSYIDLGAWVGPTVLYGAQLAKKCYAYEPDPIAKKILQHNLGLNPQINNVIISSEAVSGNTGTGEIGARTEYGDSMTSFLWEKNPMRVNTVTLAQILQQAPDCNFIKMDIEGGEFMALPPAKGFLQDKMKPTLFLSLHTPWFPNSDEYMAKMIHVLAIYKNIYNLKGEKLSLEDVTRLQGFTAIVATDK